MDYSSLIDLISSIEQGTRLHIGVIFFGAKRDKRLLLPFSATIHTSEYCWKLKESKVVADKCYRCRQLAIRKAVLSGKPFAGFCINGVWEYCHPVMKKGELIAIIFIGNILNGDVGKQKILRRLAENGLSDQSKYFLGTLESNTDPVQCEKIGTLIESYIRMLLLVCPASEETADTSPVITDMINFIEDNLYDNLSIETLAEFFHYNEKYIGRLFKKMLGCSIKMYICNRRIERATILLQNTNDSITAIATKTGFENVTYFNRRFRQLTNMSPTEYRLAFQNGKPLPEIPQYVKKSYIYANKSN